MRAKGIKSPGNMYRLKTKIVGSVRAIIAEDVLCLRSGVQERRKTRTRRGEEREGVGGMAVRERKGGIRQRGREKSDKKQSNRKKEAKEENR